MLSYLHYLFGKSILPEHIDSLCDSVRQRVFEGLKKYYQDELKMDDYSVRLGNLITFEHTLQNDYSQR
ncbi:hypothetical protein PENTCL1PPCAC_17248 [Pristionchus entomophagus]|uniref:NR LBD domain-containing protein n=1 Tax=Pristionchus entomophagus TaxID=358040 RepID=A0AAV5TLJ1_9BILA|nr:hypothetical protein PENTCL1PPCAC_17248 [Pristionchus entomophagus]